MSCRIITGDCREVLKALPDASVHCCVTSPPYFGLRDYQVDGQIGLEPTPAEFVEQLVEIFREVRRVLRDDGSVFLNLGDSYAGSGRGGYPGGKTGLAGSVVAQNETRRARRRQMDAGKHQAAVLSEAIGRAWVPPPDGLKPKDLIGIPWRVAFALQADGWWLRADNVWGKPNGMPESTKDRATRSHEYVFHLTKSETYYYGYDDVRLPPLPESTARLERSMRARLDLGDTGSMAVSGGGYAPPGQTPHTGARRSDKQRGHTRKHAGFNDRWDEMERAGQQAQGAALRSVWWIAPANFDGPHYAVMPDELAAVCILSGCPGGGIVLDPFGGVGTTGLVADQLQRNAILIELNPDNAAIARKRIDGPVPLLGVVA